MQYVVRPITDRTKFTGKHQHSRFDSTWGQTEDMLYSELRQVNARNVVLELEFLEGQLRLDGRPKSNAIASGPAAALAFESGKAAVRFATDRFRTWQDNVRGIVLGMEALRKIERYGIANSDEQYTGFKAIGAGRAAGAATVQTGGMSRRDALHILYDYIPEGVSHGIDERSVYVAARNASHPDKHFGDRTAWNACEVAGAVLGVL